MPVEFTLEMYAEREVELPFFTRHIARRVLHSLRLATLNPIERELKEGVHLDGKPYQVEEYAIYLVDSKNAEKSSRLKG